MNNPEVYIDNIYLKDNKLLNDTLSSIEETTSLRVLDYPVVYILHRDKKEVYIGETTQIRTRLKSHSKNKKQFKEALLIYHEMFNQSATYNIETNLINYFLADQMYKIENLSQTSQKVTHNYYKKKYFNNSVFDEIWQKLLDNNFVTKNKVEIENSDIFKISPFKTLTEEQIDVQNQIVDFCRTNIDKEGNHVLIIDGDAGTGKSVLLSSTFKRIIDLSNSNDTSLSGHKNNAVLVNHTEMLKTYQSISLQVAGLKKSQFYKPTSFVNKAIKNDLMFDVTFIDEAHLLLTTPDKFNNFSQDNHLEEIIKRSKITILFYDEMQVLRYKQYWNDETLKQILNKRKTLKLNLTTQMRMNSNPQTQKWINNLVKGELSNIPFDSEYELKIFDEADEMHQAIINKNKEFGLSRIVSTFDYLHKKDGALYYVEEGKFKLPWNTTDNKDSWAEVPESINEVGSIYTIQGFDLNYVGVILGPSIKYDSKTNKIIIDPDLYMDTGAFSGLGALELKEQIKIKEQIIRNSLNVLIKRGSKGLYIYASDSNLRTALRNLKNESQED